MFGPISHGVLQGEPKSEWRNSSFVAHAYSNSASAVSVFLSVAKCGRVCRAQTCAYSGLESSTLAKGFLLGGPKVRKKIEFLTISSLYITYISATAKNIGLQAAYVAFWPPVETLWNLCPVEKLFGMRKAGLCQFYWCTCYIYICSFSTKFNL